MSKCFTSLFTRVCITIFITSRLISATCYLPDGSSATNPQWLPCSNDPSLPISNICCALNRTNPSGGKQSDGDTADICLSNGICMNKAQDDQGIMQLNYRRAYCTDQEWESGNCLAICGKTGTGWKDITPCDGTNSSKRWCCGIDSTDCCNLDIASKEGLSVVTLIPTFGAEVASTSATSAPSASTSAKSTTTTTSALTTATNSPIVTSAPASSQASDTAQALQSSTPQAGLTTGVKVGIGIGIVAVAVALLGLGALLARWYRRRQEAQQAISQVLSGKADVEHTYYRYDGNAYEVDGGPVPNEVSAHGVDQKRGESFAHQTVSELPGDPGWAKDKKGTWS